MAVFDLIMDADRALKGLAGRLALAITQRKISAAALRQMADAHREGADLLDQAADLIEKGTKGT